MFTQRQASLERALLSAAVVLLLWATAAQSALLTTDLQSTAAPPLPDSSLTTQLNNVTMEEPVVLRSHRSCGSEHQNYCFNGECMYPQDTDKPSCICKPSYSGPRCQFITGPAHTLPELEQLIGIIFGAVMLFLILAIVVYCFACRRCSKSAPLIKSAPSEMSV